MQFHVAVSKEGFTASSFDFLVSTEMLRFVPLKPLDLGVMWLRQHLRCCAKPVTLPGPRHNRLERQMNMCGLIHSSRNLPAVLPVKSHTCAGIRDTCERRPYSPVAACSRGRNLHEEEIGISSSA